MNTIGEIISSYKCKVKLSNGKNTITPSIVIDGKTIESYYSWFKHSRSEKEVIDEFKKMTIDDVFSQIYKTGIDMSGEQLFFINRERVDQLNRLLNQNNLIIG
jgi:hypothetical protein